MRDIEHLDGRFMTSLKLSEPTAALDPWIIAACEGHQVLFGFSTWHQAMGGLSWLRSSPLVEIDLTASRARTASGRVYVLGRQLALRQLPDEEARLAHRLLLDPGHQPSGADEGDWMWLSALKVGRWLEKTAPERGDAAALARFIEVNQASYLERRHNAGKFDHPQRASAALLGCCH